MKTRHLLLLLLSLLVLAGWGPFSFFEPAQPVLGSPDWLNQEIKIISVKADNLNPTVLKLSLQAYMKARQEGMDDKQILTIIDYSKPSTERRLWVVDLKRGQVLFNTWVAHGKNSGNIISNSFSNQQGSLKSSFGVFLTDEPYIGGDGYSLRLKGLEQGVNDHAYARDIVMHGAWYVAEVIKEYGKLGKSWGCPAVSEKLARPLIDTIKEKTILFAYYPDQHWLTHSAFLAG